MVAYMTGMASLTINYYITTAFVLLPPISYYGMKAWSACPRLIILLRGSSGDNCQCWDSSVTGVFRQLVDPWRLLMFLRVAAVGSSSAASPASIRGHPATVGNIGESIAVAR